MKRIRINENKAESLAYVHYNLRLLTHYCERAKTDRSYVTWDNNPEEHNLEDGALTLERLEEELLGDKDDHAAATMPPPPLPPGSTSQPPPASVRGVMQDQVLDMARWLLGMKLPLPLFMNIDKGKRN